jgi:hypothetical protein
MRNLEANSRTAGGTPPSKYTISVEESKAWNVLLVSIKKILSGGLL